VVDGHSTDGTRELAASLGARVVLDNGRGKGAALRQAIEIVRGDILVFIDADGSHDPQDIPKMVDPIARGEADHCIASRMRGGSDELFATFGQFVRMLGGQMITLAINYRFGVRITDSQNGFRAFRTDAARILPLSENGTTIEQEMTIKSIRERLRMVEVPVLMRERTAGKSSISMLYSAVYMGKVMVALFVGLFRRARLGRDDEFVQHGTPPGLSGPNGCTSRGRRGPPGAA